MSSPTGGTGSDITLDDARDLLHKLITESTKVEVIFRSLRLNAVVSGFVRIAPNGWLSVEDDRTAPPRISLIMFDPSAVSSAKYGDTRAFPESASAVFLSALALTFADGTDLTIFELRV